MIYRNFLIHGAAELIDNGDGSVSWLRLPAAVMEKMEAGGAEAQVRGSTGVELRFVLRGDRAKIRMCLDPSAAGTAAVFHVYRGAIQGGWEDHEMYKCVGTEPAEYVIEKSKNIDRLRVMSERYGYGWDPTVIRVIFDRGRFRLFGIEGDICLPMAEQMPRRTLLTYGSSITHGSNSIDASHSWPAVLAHNLGMDLLNLGVAGSCCMEPETAEYLASLGEADRWQAATLELGINVLSWPEEKIRARIANILTQVAGRNPAKPIFVISPFYYCGDDFVEGCRAPLWRQLIPEIAAQLALPNVTVINGMDVLGDMFYMSADEVHPNIYGCQRIADVLTERLSPVLRPDP